MHWNASSCDYPDINNNTKDMLVGLLMGDGYIGESGSSNYFTLTMKNKRFLDWLDSELGVISTGVNKFKSGDKIKSDAEESGFIPSDSDYEFNDQYRMWTVCHPHFSELRNWYASGDMVVPESVKINNTVAKYWYISDGGLQIRDDCKPRCQITMKNMKGYKGRILSELEKSGFNPTFTTDRIVFSVEETTDFLTWIGEPVVGFENKWTGESKKYLSGGNVGEMQ
jgi:hypothetical protein